MSEYRTEHDLLGEMPVPSQALYGIHSMRAMENFSIAARKINPWLIHAYGAVKLACARTNRELGCWSDEKSAAIERACAELAEGMLDQHIVVDALQGGAGTSTNMNVNEVIANRALELLNRPHGDYAAVSPTDDINLHQSTNDTYPTALRVAGLGLLKILERDVVALLEAFQAKERQFAHVVKVARTQMQDAVLLTLGREFSAYAEAISRDRWRIYKCQERLRVVNLGGTAVGTGLGAPRQFIFRAVEHLRDITHSGLARAENLVEATQNADAFVEVHAILKSLATNLLKMCGDLRLLSSGPCAGIGEITLPARQAGSSLMPGKVNPVIPEAVSQAAMMTMANDQAISHACSMGSLELNPFLPLVADCLLGSLGMLSRACDALRRLCVEGIQVNEARCKSLVENGTAMATSLVEQIGYEKATAAIKHAGQNNLSVKQAVVELGFMTSEMFDVLTLPENVMKLGSTPNRGCDNG
ncbi:MAG: aspartate ammonia-lyase [Planctomycetes bacterium]|jgi:aspartate ammonia-lyase|nr:aspartate ammonia-lyase [Planctomycetota bacterium]